MESDGSVKKAGHVIVAVEPPAAARLMPEELSEQRDFFESVTCSPIPLAIFFLDRPLRKDIYTYINDPGLGRTFWFALDQASKVPEMVPSGKSILTAWSGHPCTLDLIGRPDDEIIRKALEDVELMVPGFSRWIEEAAVYSHPYGQAPYSTGSYRRVLDFLESAKTLKGVSFASDLFGGSYMECAMASAAAAVNRACQWGGRM
jgi:protoporphyrinogen oxidase